MNDNEKNVDRLHEIVASMRDLANEFRVIWTDLPEKKKNTIGMMLLFSVEKTDEAGSIFAVRSDHAKVIIKNGLTANLKNEGGQSWQN